MKHPVKNIRHKLSSKCFHKVHVPSNLVIPWKMEAITFPSKALHKSFHKVFHTGSEWFLFCSALLVSIFHEEALLTKETVCIYGDKMITKLLSTFSVGGVKPKLPCKEKNTYT